MNYRLSRTGTTPGLSLGRHVFGLAAVAAGIVTLLFHGPAWMYAAAAAEIAGGAAVQFGRTLKAGALILCAVFLIFALRLVPPIFATPLVFDPWGDFFEQFTLVAGAAIVYMRSSHAWTPKTVSRIGRVLFGICTVSFALYQAVHLGFTASLVPKWLPPGQMFWAVATTVAFALGAIALFANRMALLASRLLTAMLAIFGLLVWVPLLVLNPRSHSDWSETVLTFAIAGVAWILADLLAGQRP